MLTVTVPVFSNLTLVGAGPVRLTVPMLRPGLRKVALPSKVAVPMFSACWLLK